MKKVVVWNPKFVPEYIDTYSPSWRKPKEFMKEMAHDIVEAGLCVETAESAENLLPLVHSIAHIRAVKRGLEPNGFGTLDKDAAESCFYTAGGMVKGVELAKQGISSCVPVSGFHHAGYAFSGGFCTFNGLALAAVVAEGHGMNPGVLDLDMHYGNGTVDIFAKLGKEYPHWTYGGEKYASQDKGELFLGDLPRILKDKFDGCDVLLFQAGADPHINDPLGGCLTTEHLRKRDQIVFEYCKARGIPVVWDLAGGYQNPLSKVMEVHRNTFAEWIKAG